jgi:transposase
MLKPKSPQGSFFGSYLYDRIVPADHLLRKINQVVDFSFIRELLKDKYTPDFGRPAEDPEFMLRLCLLQYIYGDSDRQVIENARLNLAYKYFLGLSVDAEVPDDTTISYFRVKRLGEEKFNQVFQNIVWQCIEKGLVKGKRQIIDSTPVFADIAFHSLAGLIRQCRENVLKAVEKQNIKIAEKLGLQDLRKKEQEAKVTLKEEGLRKELDAAGKLLDGVTEELRAKTIHPLEDLQKDLGLLEKAVADRDENAMDKLLSPVDPDARTGKKTNNSWDGYKAHILMEEETEIITGVETTPANTPDGSQLKPMLKEQEEIHSIKPEELSGDKAYDWGENLESLDSKKITGNICLTKQVNRNGAGYYNVDDFLYDSENHTLMCPAGHMASYCNHVIPNKYQRNKPGYAFQFKPEQCNTCPQKTKCVKSKSGRRVYISYYEPYYRQMRERMATDEGRQAYINRYKVEHKIADLARYCSMRYCRYRGINKAKIHTLLAATVSNIKRMARLLWSKAGTPLLVPAAAC